MSQIIKPAGRRGPTQLTGRAVWQCIVDLTGSNPPRSASKKIIADVLGVDFKLVDDHVDKLLHCGEVRKIMPGHYEVTNLRPDRPVSTTSVHGAGVTVEVGDQVINGLSQREIISLVRGISGYAWGGLTDPL